MKKESIKSDSLTPLESHNVLQRFSCYINNGHTGIAFPIQLYLDYAYGGGTLFPLEIAVEDGHYLIRKNWSDETDIKIGSEIVSINDQPIDEIMSRIFLQLPGERPYYKNAKFEFFSLPRMYWQVYGRNENFNVKINTEGRIKTYSLKAVEAFDGYEMKRAEVLNFEWKLEFIEDHAYINPGEFGGNDSLYEKFIDSSFAEIKSRKSKNLIIDLRNNPGGNNSFSDYLVSYIATKPFMWNSSFSLKTSKFLKEHVVENYDTTEKFWRDVLSYENGEVYPYEFDEYQPQSKKKRFHGNVYVLINRQSYSQSAVTAAQIQDYNWATIVGEETAEYPSLYASIFSFTLPNTGIPVTVPKGFIVRVNGDRSEKGVIPDIYIKDHLLDEEDEILDGLLNILNKED